jgi:3,4-dihydroxy 2-butanone 4-phosphate synthase/GTP cyclohydrolase II
MISSVSEILNDFKMGKFVLITDDEDRENEGDLIIAAEFVQAHHINFLAKHARGLICLSLTQAQIDKLKLPLMASPHHQAGATQTAFTVSIEAAHGISTGISAADRALTVQVAANPKAVPTDLICPGHIFPLRANNDGVLGRPGHTEASIDLARLSGLNPAAVICEVMNDDGTMARMSDLVEFSKLHQIKIGTISDLIQYRKSHL